MAKKIWGKYVIGITSVLAIGGAIGIAQKIDAMNYPEQHKSATPHSSTLGEQNTDNIQQEFQVQRPRRAHHRRELDDQNQNNSDQDWFAIDQGNNSNGTSMRSRSS